jgi:FkbM family methyltransferase
VTAIAMLARLFSLLSRFCTATAVLGLGDSLKIFVLGHVPGMKLRLTLPNRASFFCDSRIDQGVLEHFYKLGHVVHDAPGCRVTRIIDGGANIGDETARFRFHHPDAVIAAVEPASRNFRLLERNFTSDRNVRLFHGGLWPKAAQLRVVAGGCSQAFTVSECIGSEEEQGDLVRGFSIPEIMKVMDWQELVILKLDIEGAEKRLFTENTADWIDCVRCVIFEVADHEGPGMTQAIFDALGGHRFCSTICGENLILIRDDTPWTVGRVNGFARAAK